MSCLINPHRFAVTSAAAPVYQSVASTTNSITPTYQASINADDTLIGVVVANGTYQLDYSAPAGFTLLTKVRITNGSGNLGVMYVWYKIADGTESGTTATFVHNGGGLNAHQAWVIRYTGATGIENLRAHFFQNSSTEALTSPAITNTVGTALIVNLWGQIGAQSLTPEGGWTEEFEHITNNVGAADFSLVHHSTNSAGVGTQTTEEPTPSAACSFACVSFALIPSGTTTVGSLSIRGTSKTWVNNTNSASIALPTGSAAGDRMFIFGHHGWFLGSNPPYPWAQMDTLSGSNVSGAWYEKVLTPADITAGSVTIGFGGSWYGQLMAATFVGCTGGVRTWESSRNGTNTSPRTITLNASGAPDYYNPQAGDYGLFYGGNRAASSNTIDQGSALQTDNQTDGGAALYGGAIGSSGSLTVNFTYGTLGTGDYQVALVVEKSGCA